MSVMIKGGSTKNGWAGRLHPMELSYRVGGPIANGYRRSREIGCAMCKVKERQVTIYNTWGRRACPSGSKTVYSGWMANGQYHQQGGGYNYMCMHQDGDIEAKQKSDAQNAKNSGLLHRVEYAKSTKSNGGTAWSRILAMNYRDAACSVCEVEEEDTLMLPAKNTCPEGYEQLYVGYVAGAHSYHKHETEYICLDQKFEELDKSIFKLSSNANQNSARLFLGEVNTAFYGLKYKLNSGIECVMCVKK